MTPPATLAARDREPDPCPRLSAATRRAMIAHAKPSLIALGFVNTSAWRHGGFSEAQILRFAAEATREARRELGWE